MLTEKDYEFFRTVVAEYEKSKSIRDTSMALNISRVKVRKILITMGAITSSLTEQALAMKKEGMCLESIAKSLGCSVSTLSTYLPYDDRVYGREDKSDVASRIEKYIERQQSAASTMKQERAVKKLHVIDTASYTSDEIDMLRRKAYQEEQDFDPFISHESMYLLRFELLNTKENATVLRHFGKMQNGIIRDVFVPGEMTLHSMHYMIQRLFGWQNEHQHHFALADHDFSLVTGDRFQGYTDLCGPLFRFPESDISDKYWDDDYEEGMPIGKWFKTKYRRPYKALSVGDTLSDNLRKVKEFNNPDYDIASNYGFIDDVQANCLVECLTISELLIGGAQGDVNAWKRDIIGKTVNWKAMQNKPWDEEKTQLRRWRESLSATSWYIHSKQEYYIREKTGMNAKTFLRKCNSQVRLLEAQCLDYFVTDRISPLPYFNELIYAYDYGDDWHVKISCLKRYERKTPMDFCKGNYLCASIFDDKDALKKYMYFDGDVQVQEELRCKLAQIEVSGQPICIQSDGLNVVEDVGGVNGFCDFLMTINGSDKAEAASLREWARGLGWTGRMSKPENIL